MLAGLRTLRNRDAIVTSGWVAKPDDDGCNGCGSCAKVCPVEAIEIVPATPTAKAPKRKKRAQVNADTCLGCGVCVRHCKTGLRALGRAARRVHTPESMMEKMMLQALERGKLQNLLFDDGRRLSHRVGNAVVRLLMGLPPTKAALASSQLKSRFAQAMVSGFARTGSGRAAKV